MQYAIQNPGVMAMVMHRLERQQIPRMLTIKSHVDQGQPLSDSNIEYIQEILQESQSLGRFAEKHLDYQILFSRLVSLSSGIIHKAAENESTRVVH